MQHDHKKVATTIIYFFLSLTLFFSCLSCGSVSFSEVLSNFSDDAIKYSNENHFSYITGRKAIIEKSESAYPFYIPYMDLAYIENNKSTDEVTTFLFFENTKYITACASTQIQSSPIPLISCTKENYLNLSFYNQKALSFSSPNQIFLPFSMAETLVKKGIFNSLEQIIGSSISLTTSINVIQNSINATVAAIILENDFFKPFVSLCGSEPIICSLGSSFYGKPSLSFIFKGTKAATFIPYLEEINEMDGLSDWSVHANQQYYSYLFYSDNFERPLSEINESNMKKAAFYNSSGNFPYFLSFLSLALLTTIISIVFLWSKKRGDVFPRRFALYLFSFEVFLFLIASTFFSLGFRFTFSGVHFEFISFSGVSLSLVLFGIIEGALLLKEKRNHTINVPGPLFIRESGNSR
jgi:hypothetical protein